MRVVRAIWISAAFVFLLAFSVPFQILIALLAPSQQHHLPKLVFGAAARVMGARICAQGPVPARGPLLIVANHVSWIDAIAIGATLPCQFIAKSEVAGWPVFGPLARLIRTAFVDRDRRSAVGAVRDDMADRLAQNHILVLFPEGTSSDGRQVLPFKSALFPSGETTDVAVQPLSIAYRDAHGRDGVRYGWFGDLELLPHMWRVFKGGRFDVHLIFHPVLSPTDQKDRKDLAKRCEEIVREGLALAAKASKETSQIAPS